jgi:hypothetical protein
LETTAPKLTCESFSTGRGSIVMDCVAEGIFTLCMCLNYVDMVGTVCLSDACAVNQNWPQRQDLRHYIYMSLRLTL